MTDKTLEDKAVEILDASQQAIGAFADKLGDLAKQYGPDVMDAALQMARVDAINALVVPITSLIIFAVVYTVFWKKAWPKLAEVHDGGFAAFMLHMFFVPWFGFSLFHTLNVWAWVGIFEPKLWLAKRILGL